MLDRRTCARLAAALMVLGACSDDSSGTDATNAATSASAPVETTTVETTGAETTTLETTVAPTTTEVGSSYDFAEVAGIIDDFVDEHDLNGAGLVIVDRDGGVVGELYNGDFSADRVSLVASSSKMITAGVLLRLQDQGLLDLDAPISTYVPWATTGNPDITVAQMLSNSSGLAGLFPEPGYGPYVCQFVGAEMEACAAEVFATTADDDVVVPPDTEYRYGGVQWQVAGAVAETVSGKSWEQLLDETYREPCGVQSLGYNNHWVSLGGGGFDYPPSFDVAALVPTENPHMEGGAYINPVDYAALLLMHLREGQCDNGQVLSPAAVEEAHADRIGEVWGGSATADTGYGMGWWVDRVSGRVYDPGAYGSVPWLDVGNGLGAYLVIEGDSATGIQLANMLYEPVEAAVIAGR